MVILCLAAQQKGMVIKMRNLIDITDLTTKEIDGLIATAEDIIARPEAYSQKCRGKKIATLFYEPSTRTRLSFESAMLDLGGSVIGFSSAADSSVSKGESVSDTARTAGCFADIIAMRHPKEGAPFVAAKSAGVPVINAGDGGRSHPTQTLTDLLTIKCEKGHLDHMVVGCCGDLRFGRTVHSLIGAMAVSGIRFVLISPEELTVPEHVRSEILQKSGTGFRETGSLSKPCRNWTSLLHDPVQRRAVLQRAGLSPPADSYILTPEKLIPAKPDLTILHPLPRVNETPPPWTAIRAPAISAGTVRQVHTYALILKLLENQVERR
jgi:aspartate carbamoyltransferase catalytic subunit